jgi:hypothetical protein
VRRDELVRPLVDKFFDWARAEFAKLEGRGLVATAFGYSVRQEQALRRFLEDGRLRMGNNSAENALRNVALGRKVFLFYGSDDHATAAGNILSLAASCKLHDLDPELYSPRSSVSCPTGRAIGTSSSLPSTGARPERGSTRKSSSESWAPSRSRRRLRNSSPRRTERPVSTRESMRRARSPRHTAS